ncbi:MAG: thioredoxin [Lachnospiraceae bacterium]|nr:thioredoxin [Lachnospiraceae bacterium]
MAEVIFTPENFEEEVLKSDIPVMVDFYADWCGPCKMMMPVVESLAEEYEGKVKIGKIDSDEAGELAQKYGIMSIPNFLFFKNGEKVDNLIGAVSEDALAEKLDSLL